MKLARGRDVLVLLALVHAGMLGWFIFDEPASHNLVHDALDAVHINAGYLVYTVCIAIPIVELLCRGRTRDLMRQVTLLGWTGAWGYESEHYGIAPIRLAMWVCVYAFGLFAVIWLMPWIRRMLGVADGPPPEPRGFEVIHDGDKPET